MERAAVNNYAFESGQVLSLSLALTLTLTLSSQGGGDIDRQWRRIFSPSAVPTPTSNGRICLPAKSQPDPQRLPVHLLQYLMILRRRHHHHHHLQAVQIEPRPFHLFL
jgi:hypothetical protein